MISSTRRDTVRQITLLYNIIICLSYTLFRHYSDFIICLAFNPEHAGTFAITFRFLTSLIMFSVFGSMLEICFTQRRRKNR